MADPCFLPLVVRVLGCSDVRTFGLVRLGRSEGRRVVRVVGRWGSRGGSNRSCSRGRSNSGSGGEADVTQGGPS
eukprot:8536555-Pyramimonas_sp.AAC.1